MCWPMVALGRWSHAPCLFIHAASPPEPYPLSLHDALPICGADGVLEGAAAALGAHGREGDVVADVLAGDPLVGGDEIGRGPRSEEHTSELQSRENLVCRLLLEEKKHPAGSSRGTPRARQHP